MASTSTIAIVSTNELLYAPQFVAESRGYFADQGLQVTFQGVPSAYGLRRTLARHGPRCRCVLLGSLWLCLIDGSVTDPLVPVAVSNSNCHHVAVCRQSVKCASLGAILRGATIVIPAGAPTPFAALQGALFAAGLTLADVKLVTGLTPRDSWDMFDGGFGDLVVLPAHWPALGGREGTWPLSALTGDLPWSVYFTRAHNLQFDSGVAMRKFCVALKEAQSWMGVHTGREIAATVSGRFGNEQGVTAAVDRLRGIRVWPTEPTLDMARAEAWESIMRAAGLIVDPSPALKTLMEGAANAGFA